MIEYIKHYISRSKFTQKKTNAFLQISEVRYQSNSETWIIQISSSNKKSDATG